MDHFLEDGREFGLEGGSQLGGEMLPDTVGLCGHRTSSAAESKSSKAAKVSLVETLGWANPRVVASSAMRNVVLSW